MSEYKDLSNLIYPNVKGKNYYEEKYPERDLKEGAKVVRFAPSPTGFVHIGSLFTSLVVRKIATQTEGVYFLRIEDTDKKREVKNGVTGIVNSLSDFGILPDEGMFSETEEKGNYGPYTQSHREDIYKSFAKDLIEKGYAYPCFATEEELSSMREKQEAAKVIPGYYGIWAKYRNMPIEEAITRINNGEKYVIRLKSRGDQDKKIVLQDVIKGKVEFPENNQDAVMIKGDGLPTYHFAHGVDDYLMRTNLVIRGDEWLPSVPLHLEIFRAIGVKPPKFAHVAPIMKNEDGNKRKLSKRKDPESAVSYYKEEGVPNTAVIDYLLNIANANFEGWRRENPYKSYNDFKFEIAKMGAGGALLDLVKLLDVSKNTISLMTANEVYDRVIEWSKEYDKELFELLNKNKEYAIKIFNIERETKKPRKDISKWSDVKDLIVYMYDNLYLSTDKNYDFQAINNKEDIKEILNEYISKCYDENDDKQEWFNKIKKLAGTLGYAEEVKEYKANPKKYKAHVGDVSMVIRIALTGRVNTPDMYEIINILGKESMEKRFEYCLNKI